MDRPCSTHGGKRNICIYGFCGKVRKKATCRTIQTWNDNIKTDLGEVGWGCVAWIYLAEDRD
jgi:hypothetical protein